MDTYPNPFDARNFYQPFAGRERAVGRINQHLADPLNTPVPAFYGRAAIGKTALLRQFTGPPTKTYVSIYLPLATFHLTHEMDWMQALINTTLNTLEAHQMTVTSAERPAQADVDRLKTWYAEDFLPAVFRVIRRNRRLLLLIDDAEKLLQMDQDAVLDSASLPYLHQLRGENLTLALTLDEAVEDNLTAFRPLFEPKQALRLTNLDAPTCAQVFRQAGIHLEDDAAQHLHRLSGGQPDLINRFGYHLYEERGQRLTTTQVKAAVSAVYDDKQATFHTRWSQLSLDERLVLTAVSSRLYDHPLRPVTIETIETWLVETDYPLDPVTIRATVRGLQYHELIIGDTTQGLRVASGMLQKWMLENARLDDPTPGNEGNRLMLLAGILIALLVLGAILLLASTPSGTPNTQIPTAPLITPGS